MIKIYKYILQKLCFTKYLLTVLCYFFIISKTIAQTNNIYLDGENYITLNNPGFPSRLVWQDASKQRITMTASQFPIKTYWFSHNGKSYIIINLTSGKSDIYIELGSNKSTYHFPTDFNQEGKVGAANNFHLYVTNTSGILQKLSVIKNTQLFIKVLQLDSLHVKLSFNGTIVPYSNPGGESELEIGDPSPPIAISGKISLSKKSPILQKLPDNYADCDNTIYNEMSPDFASGQYYSATECEESFYKKVFNTLNSSLSPAINYLKSKNWIMSSLPKYNPLEKRLKNDMPHFFRTDPNTGIDYDMDVNANPMKGAYKEYSDKLMTDIQLFAKGDTSKLREVTAMQKEEPAKFKLHLQVTFNQPVLSNYKLDLTQAQIKKISDNMFLVENVQSTGNFNFHEDGGTYLFVGKWTEPKFEDGYIVCSPILQPAAKKLSIQAMYMRIGCGNELASTLVKNIDLVKLQQLLTTTP